MKLVRMCLSESGHLVLSCRRMPLLQSVDMRHGTACQIEAKILDRELEQYHIPQRRFGGYKLVGRHQSDENTRISDTPGKVQGVSGSPSVKMLDRIQSSMKYQCGIEFRQKYTKWAPQDHDTLNEAIRRHGRKWKLIQAQYFPNKKVQCLKNKFYAEINKKKVKDAHKPVVVQDVQRDDSSLQFDEPENMLQFDVDLSMFE